MTSTSSGRRRSARLPSCASRRDPTLRLPMIRTSPRFGSGPRKTTRCDATKEIATVEAVSAIGGAPPSSEDRFHHAPVTSPHRVLTSGAACSLQCNREGSRGQGSEVPGVESRGETSDGLREREYGILTRPPGEKTRRARPDKRAFCESRFVGTNRPARRRRRCEQTVGPVQTRRRGVGPGGRHSPERRRGLVGSTRPLECSRSDLITAQRTSAYRGPEQEVGQSSPPPRSVTSEPSRQEFVKTRRWYLPRLVRARGLASGSTEGAPWDGDRPDFRQYRGCASASKRAARGAGVHPFLRRNMISG